MTKKGKLALLSLLSTVILLLIWKIFALLVGADIILPPPEKVFMSLIDITTSKGFLSRVGTTIIRGLFGFFISYLSAIIIGTLAGIYPLFKSFIQPLLSVIKSTPVISVILLALIWFNTDYVPVFVAFLMAFPIVCTNIIEGITTVDQKLLDMATIYKIPLKKQVTEIYLPSILPFILAGASMSLGIIWKVVIAAEVLSQPKWGVGTSLNEAKAFLITQEVFAWTTIAILLSFITDIIFNKSTKFIKWRNCEVK